MNRNTPRLSIAARRRIVEAVQRIERPMSRRVVGDPSHNAYARDNDGERPCECGYSVCAKRGPCAPQVTPKPSARALDNLPAEPSPAGGRFKIGDRVRHRSGLTGTVVGAPEPAAAWGEINIPVHEDGGAETLLWESYLEPAPSPVSEAPAVESDPVAECKRLGITLRQGSSSPFWGAAALVGDTHRVIVGFESKHADRESCTRAALEAWSRREPAQ